MKKRIPIGVSDFKSIIEEKYYFIDKSLFIKEVVEDGSKVILLPRPRRFGKTLNISMLKYFYEKSEEDNRNLFDNLKINEYKNIMNVQGKYPVIYISFKDMKDNNFQSFLMKIKDLIAEEYGRHRILVKEDILEEEEKNLFKDILNSTASQERVELSLKYLSKYLFRYYKQKCVIIIDEYDVPIQSGYINSFYDEVIGFMRNFLTGGLKDNIYLEKAVLTGILRVAKESIFSGLNNLKVSTLLSKHYSDFFGFTDFEIEEILRHYGIEYEIDEVRRWYNGYIFGSNIIYNPWSILNYIDNEAEYRPYWVNTSSNDLVKRVLARGTEKLKTELESLIKGESIEKLINEDIVMKDIDSSSENVWSFLLFSGYLKVIDRRLEKGKTYCTFKIPNLEVQYLYEEIILGWFNENISSDKFSMMLKSLVSGDIKTFSKIFKELVLNSVSYFDISGRESEKVYHSFVLGMLVGLSDDYEVRSNRESGYGRYDVMVIPRDLSKKGIIIEFKKVDEDEDLEVAATNALKQIEGKQYRQELLDRGVKDIIEIGIAFEGKMVLVKQKN
jgi:hypothetical protein